MPVAGFLLFESGCLGFKDLQDVIIFINFHQNIQLWRSLFPRV